MVLSEPKPLVYRAARPQREDGVVCITVEDYHAMIAAGIYGEDDKIELIGGLLLEKMSINPPHASSVRKVRRLLAKRIDETQDVHSESPLVVDESSEVEPDGMLVPFRDDDYAHVRPVASQVSLVVEVADETLRKDRKVKLPRYAAAGIPEYWIVNLRQRQLERYTRPEAGQTELELEPRYGKTEVFAAGESLDHPDLGAIAVVELLPAVAADE